MEHKEVIKLIQDFYHGKRVFILPSTTSDSYTSEADHRLGIEKHLQMAELLNLLRENSRDSRFLGPFN